MKIRVFAINASETKAGGWRCVSGVSHSLFVVVFSCTGGNILFDGWKPKLSATSKWSTVSVLCQFRSWSSLYLKTVNGLNNVEVKKGWKFQRQRLQLFLASFHSCFSLTWWDPYVGLPYPNSQLAKEKPTLLSWYPTISSHWADSATVTLNLGWIWVR